nr:centrin-2 [Ipomoea batatas]
MANVSSTPFTYRYRCSFPEFESSNSSRIHKLEALALDKLEKNGESCIFGTQRPNRRTRNQASDSKEPANRNFRKGGKFHNTRKQRLKRIEENRARMEALGHRKMTAFLMGSISKAHKKVAEQEGQEEGGCSWLRKMMNTNPLKVKGAMLLSLQDSAGFFRCEQSTHKSVGAHITEVTAGGELLLGRLLTPLEEVQTSLERERGRGMIKEERDDGGKDRGRPVTVAAILLSRAAMREERGKRYVFAQLGQETWRKTSWCGNE